MAMLTEEHIHYIQKDLTYRGLVHESLQQEMLDHICSAVEQEMEGGKRFYDAYQNVLRSFGNTRGLRRIQHQVIHTKTKTTGMLKNYLMIALRNHSKNKFYTLINIAGLAIGIAACLVIVLYAAHEVSYDRFHENAGRIYRVNTKIKVGSVQHQLALASASVGERFSQEFPEIESTVRLWPWGDRMVRREDQPEPNPENVAWGDSTFFSVFTIPVLQGNAASALKEPNTVAISRTMAEKYFATGGALDQTLIIDDGQSYKVTAVYEDLPDNSHFHFDAVRSITGLDEAKSESLIGGAELNLYLLLKEGANPNALEEKFDTFVDKHVAPQLAAVMQNDFSIEKFKAEGNIWQYSLTPLTWIHLHSDMTGEIEPNGSIAYVYLFSAIALFILAIACINFMNLSTARSADRAREVGIRKVMGSLRSHLVRQFLVESSILSITAFLFAIGLAYVFLPVFNQLADKSLTLPFQEYTFYLGMACAAVFVGVLAGLYPSFFLSGFRPVNVLKGKITAGHRSGFVRGGLVVFQFVISIFLIIATISVERQLNFIQHKKIGFNKDQVVVVHQASFLENQVQTFKDEVLKNSFISGGTISGYLPVTGTWRNGNTYWPEGKAPTGEDVNDMISLQTWEVDYDYIITLGMTLKYGRNFSRGFPSDSTQAVIINEAAVEQLELGDEPIGKKISAFGGITPEGTPDLNQIKTWEIIGVVEDFHYASMRNNIAPLGLFLGYSNGFVSFRFESADTRQVLTAISDTWRRIVPDRTFDYSFLDEDFGQMYTSERRLGTIFAIFAGLAIVIACLGLFALTSFTAQQRTKEIGIRKTLGASVESIVLLLSKTYGKLILVAFLISIPLSWYAVNQWLSGYSYRAEIGVFVYLSAGAVALIIAMITIAFLCIRAASANPANLLRSE